MRALITTLVTLGALGALGCSDSADGPAGGAGTSSGGSAGSPVAGTAGDATSGSGGAPSGGGGSASGGSAGGGGAGAASACAIPAMGMEPPTLLSQTGCVDMAEPTKAPPGFIPYSVRSPLWSDGAEKHRFLRIPSGSNIHVVDCTSDAESAACVADTIGGDDGHWQMPVGTVLVKNFSLQGKIIETRLVMRRSMTRWLFYSYEWNDAATEATLLPDDDVGKSRDVGAQTWQYPGRGQCVQCHTPGAGFSLGPSTPQMNSDFAYADGTMNQVEKLAQLELFDAPPRAMPGLPETSGTETLEDRALSYIHANCAVCHRPSGEYSGMDMRWATAKAAGAIDGMQLCDAVERDGDKPMMPKYRVVPGQPEKSAMSFRMHVLTEVRMPKLGSNVVDPVGVKLVDDWIAAMPTTACPSQP